MGITTEKKTESGSRDIRAELRANGYVHVQLIRTRGPIHQVCAVDPRYSVASANVYREGNKAFPIELFLSLASGCAVMVHSDKVVFIPAHHILHAEFYS